MIWLIIGIAVIVYWVKKSNVKSSAAGISAARPAPQTPQRQNATCPFCGTALEDGMTFCPKDGAKVR